MKLALKDKKSPPIVETPGISFEEPEHPLIKRLNFRYELRGYQKEILELVTGKIGRGSREVHLVAPPGAGKTIIGLQILSHLRRPALILSPNTTIQAQWAQKLSLFTEEGSSIDLSELIGTHEDNPAKPITALTYQVLSTPGKEQEYLENLARKEWVQELRANRALSVGEAEIRILEIFQNNETAYKKEISRHTTKLRRRLTEVLKIEEVLHKNAIDLIQNLRRNGVSTVIFDECHHLTDYWAAIMHHVVKMLDDPVVIALTGTPPEGKSSKQSHRYSTLVGGVDYQVPTPALVRERGLAPFQDLVYFTRPTQNEYAFLASQHEGFHELIEELIGKSADEETYTIVDTSMEDPNAGELDDNGKRYLADPIFGDYADRVEMGLETNYQVRDSSGKVSIILSWLFNKMLTNARADFNEFVSSNTKLADAMLRAMWLYKLPVPKEVRNSKLVVRPPDIDDWMIILEEFASGKLKVSKDKDAHKLYKRIQEACRELGYGITEGGLRKQASPVDRVLAFSKSKGHAVNEILAVEFRSLQETLRAIVVTDFEKMSATGKKSIEGILDDEAGGAIAVFRTILDCPLSQFVNPVLVSGTSLLTDRRITEKFVKQATRSLRKKGYLINIDVEEIEGEPFDRITSQSQDWEPRQYVRLATEIFEGGLTKCLVGTRGLFGEGWDSQALNTLIDLTSATAPVTVKQLRGRSIRIDNSSTMDGVKVANNWDVVCIAPDLEKGLNDYRRFSKKHKQFFGVSDDGQIEKGVGHVHPDLSDITGLEVFKKSKSLNDEMIDRAFDRTSIYDLWQVGKPYRNKVTNCIEIGEEDKLNIVPPYLKYNTSQKEHGSEIERNLNLIIIESLIPALVIPALIHMLVGNLWITAASFILSTFGFLKLSKMRFELLRNRYKKDILKDGDKTAYLVALSRALISALRRQNLIGASVNHKHLTVSRRSNGNTRIIISCADPKDENTFLQALKELIGPLSNQKYIVARQGFALNVADVDKESHYAKFFDSYMKNKVKPSQRSYHPVPKILARSEKGRQAFLDAWCKYVSQSELIEADKRPDLIAKNFGIAPSVADREIWE